MEKDTQTPEYGYYGASHAAAVPLEPIESDPIEFYRGRDIAHDIAPLLLDAVARMPLGAYDRRIISWAAGAFDQPTMVTLASLVERAKDEGYRQGFADGREQGR